MFFQQFFVLFDIGGIVRLDFVFPVMDLDFQAVDMAFQNLFFFRYFLQLLPEKLHRTGAEFLHPFFQLLKLCFFFLFFFYILKQLHIAFHWVLQIFIV